MFTQFRQFYDQCAREKNRTERHWGDIGLVEGTECLVIWSVAHLERKILEGCRITTMGVSRVFYEVHITTMADSGATGNPYGAPPAFGGYPGSAPGMAAPPGLGKLLSCLFAASISTGSVGDLANIAFHRTPTRHVFCSRDGPSSGDPAVQRASS